MIVTPKGSIIRTVDGPSPKVETDPGWEARKAAREGGCITAISISSDDDDLF